MFSTIQMYLGRAKRPGQALASGSQQLASSGFGYTWSMRKRRIPIASTIPPAKWAIPVDEHAKSRERGLMKNWEEYCAYLASLGFEQVACVQSKKHQAIEYGGAHHPEKYAMWQHPAGLIAYGHSYTTGGYQKSDGTYVPLRTELGSIDVQARIDVGVGPEAVHRSSVLIRGSGGSDPQLDGSLIRNINATFHGNTGTLANWLESVQKHGRFLPFERWNTSIVSSSVYLPNELIFPVASENDLPEGAEKVAFDQKEALKSFCDKLPQPLDKVVFQLFYRTHSDKQKSKRWVDVEEGINHFSEILSLGKKRWSSDYDSSLLTHWQEVALGEVGEDISKWRAFEKGPAGLSLPVALIHARPRTGAHERLFRLLDEAPDDVLARWACVPDAGGYTLALHAINALMVRRDGFGSGESRPNEDLPLGVLTRLRNRLGDMGVVLETSKRSVLGLVPQYYERYDTKYISRMEIDQCMEPFNKVINQLEEWGLAWDRTLRWRSYPNTMNPHKREGNPYFFDLERPPVPKDLHDALGAEPSPATRVLISLVGRKRLQQIVAQQPEPQGEPRSRPRM